MSVKKKLLNRLQSHPTDLKWDEVTRIMKGCGFTLIKGAGSRRVFRHDSGIKVFVHEPHPSPFLKKYAIDALLDGLKATGEIA